MYSYQVLWITSIFSSALAVGPIRVKAHSSTIIPDMQIHDHPKTERPNIQATQIDRLWEEIGGVKTVMATISGQLERFNDLYLGKLEHRMLTGATLLASIDSNIRTLQERSHVWDTFQLHVAAWNEQIKTVDNKMDLLSRGQEKMIVLDTKLSQLASLEYKLERVAARLEETFQRIQQLEPPRDPLVGEFTVRGVLSTLKIVERKVDRVQTGIHSIGTTLKPKKKRNETDEATGKLIIRCNTPPAVEEALQDVQAKVDLVYDKLVAEPESNELSDQPNDGTDLGQAETRILNKLWKRLSIPHRKTAKSLETIENLLRGLNSTSRPSPDSDEDIQELLSCCRASGHRVNAFTENAETLMKRVEGIVNQAHSLSASSQDTLERGFHEQRSYLELSLSKLQHACSKEHEVKIPSGSIPVAPDYEGSGDTTDDEGSGDDEDVAEGSGSAVGVTIVPFGSDTSIHESVSDEDEASATTTTLKPITKTWNSMIPVQTTTLLPMWLTTVENEPTTVENFLTEIQVDEKSCEALANTARASGVYKLGSTSDKNAAGRDFYTRNCELETSGGGWTVVQQRGGLWGGKENFTRTWDDYKYGFGDISGEFWMGNEYIHRLSYETDVALRVELEDWDGVVVWAEYSTFRVDAEPDNYRIWISGYEGNATDAFGAHDGTPFSTIDRDNDGAPPCCPCAPAYGGGWWFYSCFEANLNGDYYAENAPHEPFRGVIWEHWRGDYSLKTSRMMLRPRSFGDISLDQFYPDP